MQQMDRSAPTVKIGQGNLKFNQEKVLNGSNGMDTDEYGLVDDIFLVNELNGSFTNSSGDSSPLNSSDDDLMELMKSAVDERKPFESFEKQITITVPQPPPLKADAFSIGGGLFDGKIFSFIIFNSIEFCKPKILTTIFFIFDPI